jgi:asparagine synthetase B (glutamine-hydrolysing)
MGNSIEVRVPLADHVLFERVAGLPIERRFAHGETKPLLKRLLRPLLPDEVLTRPKRGFAPPDPFVHAIVRQHQSAILESPDLRGWLDVNRLNALLRDYLDHSPAATLPGSRRARIQRLGRTFAHGGFLPEEAGWMLFSLAAVVRCRESWRPS